MGILEEDGEIVAVFTDINMPGKMDGISLALCVRERWPPIVIVICSAYALADMRPTLPDIEYLAKPYDRGRVSKVARSVRSRLDNLP